VFIIMPLCTCLFLIVAVMISLISLIALRLLWKVKVVKFSEYGRFNI